MTQEELLSRIERNPEIMFGKPIIKGTRMPVDLLLEKLAHGYSETDIMQDYPFISSEDIKSVFLYAARMISLEEEFSIV